MGVWVCNQARQPKKNPREINSEVEKKKIQQKKRVVSRAIVIHEYPRCPSRNIFVDYVISALFCLESGMNRTLISS